MVTVRYIVYTSSGKYSLAVYVYWTIYKMVTTRSKIYLYYFLPLFYYSLNNNEKYNNNNSFFIIGTN